MASLRKRGEIYYIRFSKTREGEQKQVSFSLGTTSKDEAIALKLEYENKYRRGRMDPFNGWSPQKEIELKRYHYWGQYILLSDAINNFVSERAHLSDNTLKSYRRHLGLFMKYLGASTLVTTITEQQIRTFCFKSKLKPTTQTTYLRHLRVFFQWLYQKHILPEDVVKNIQAPTIPKTNAKKTITETELQQIFRACDNYRSASRFKYPTTKPFHPLQWFKPMISTIYYCGFRAGEAVQLRWEYIDFDRQYIRIINRGPTYIKNRQERTIPFRKPLIPILQRWHLKHHAPSKGLVFPKPISHSTQVSMNSATVSKTFKKFVREADLPDTITLHGLRHSCATELLRKGMPIHLVSKFLGHQQITTTQIYEHLNEMDIKKAIDCID
ncbi:MAG: tyrosine-type recombinase/integrase [Balneolaceae bacterium]|nr:tyrosine-type recombinase/integrase [Balneolaceae bacterium]